MDKLKATLLVSMGILASGSGMIQVEATAYSYFVDFDTKTVANFNDYTQTFLDTTSDLDNRITYTVNTFYRMNACPPSAATDVFMQMRYQLNGTGTSYTTNVELPDMPCTTVNTFYQITGNISIPKAHIEYVVNDDANYIFFNPALLFRASGATPGRVITLTDPTFVYGLHYDFNTTYLFNYFLSDSQGGTFIPFLATLVPGGTIINDFDYVMTTAGNDEYFIINSNTTNYGTTRTKWAIDYEDEYFRGESIGSRYRMIYDGEITVNVPSSGSSANIVATFRHYYLNAANKEQDISNVPEFEFEYEDCGWDAFDIPCFINNGLAYVVNDAPVISDAFTLLNAGMKMGGQAFAIIGQFSDNNLFGVLVLGGLGITAVRWFLKQD